MNPTIVASASPASARVLTDDALAFLAALHREFQPARQALLLRRQERAHEIAAGARLGFPDRTAEIRSGDWQVARTAADLEDRRVEITGPVERKMMINALNSGAQVFMADLEDATSPTWTNIMEGQANLMDAVRRTIRLETGDRTYELADRTATLVVRPRGWHLHESHLAVDGAPMSASLVDFGLHFHHNARALIEAGSGPYFYLPKLESHLEARLWNDVFVFAQDALGIPRGTIRATVLVETIHAAFEMDEILFELREHAAGLNAGRWDYLFSVIKTFRSRPDACLPDRAQLTMTVPFMRAYTDLLVRTCHRRGAHAIGGMAAFIPNRRDQVVNDLAMGKVREDKQREAGDGFDGTWVAHPDLVPVARAVFDSALGDRPHQKDRLREEVQPDAAALQQFTVEGGTITAAGVRTNIDVALRYLSAWLGGQGAVAIHNLMEDAATAEISRSQLWQWIQLRARLVEGETMGPDVYRRLRDEVVADLRADPAQAGPLDDAVALLEELVLGEFQDFLTVPGYMMLTRGPAAMP